MLIELLADGQAMTPEQLRAELMTAGEDLPIDSVLAAEIVAAVQDQYGIRLPETGVESYLRSVHAFAAQVCAEVERAEAGEARRA